MWISARMTAYDVMDQVCVTAQVWADPGDGSPLSEILRVSLTTKGFGETDPSAWLRDALVSLAETL